MSSKPWFRTWDNIVRMEGSRITCTRQTRLFNHFIISLSAWNRKKFFISFDTAVDYESWATFVDFIFTNSALNKILSFFNRGRLDRYEWFGNPCSNNLLLCRVLLSRCNMRQRREVDMESMEQNSHRRLRHQSSDSYHQLYRHRVQCNGMRNKMIDSVLKYFCIGNLAFTINECGSGYSLRKYYLR